MTDAGTHGQRSRQSRGRLDPHRIPRRTQPPAWRKELSERFREIQQRSAREAAPEADEAARRRRRRSRRRDPQRTTPRPKEAPSPLQAARPRPAAAGRAGDEPARRRRAQPHRARARSSPPRAVPAPARRAAARPPRAWSRSSYEPKARPQVEPARQAQPLVPSAEATRQAETEADGRRSGAPAAARRRPTRRRLPRAWRRRRSQTLWNRRRSRRGRRFKSATSSAGVAAPQPSEKPSAHLRRRQFAGEARASRDTRACIDEFWLERSRHRTAPAGRSARARTTTSPRRAASAGGAR